MFYTHRFHLDIPSDFETVMKFIRWSAFACLSMMFVGLFGASTYLHFTTTGRHVLTDAPWPLIGLFFGGLCGLLCTLFAFACLMAYCDLRDAWQDRLG